MKQQKEIRIPIGMTAAEAEKRLILATLESCEGNKVRTAATLNLSLTTIYQKLAKYQAAVA